MVQVSSAWDTQNQLVDPACSGHLVKAEAPLNLLGVAPPVVVFQAVVFFHSDKSIKIGQQLVIRDGAVAGLAPKQVMKRIAHNKLLAPVDALPKPL